jgi:hypothetical protein
MQRILIVLRGPVDIDVLRRRCDADLTDVSTPYELAVCLVLPDGQDGLHQAVRAQRDATAALRVALGPAAEGLAVFVASERGVYGVDDCAREWGATVVIP